MDIIKTYEDIVNSIITKYNAAHSKAVEACKRGDARNYKKYMAEMHDLEGMMEQVNSAVAV